MAPRLGPTSTTTTCASLASAAFLRILQNAVITPERSALRSRHCDHCWLSSSSKLDSAEISDDQAEIVVDLLDVRLTGMSPVPSLERTDALVDCVGLVRVVPQLLEPPLVEKGRRQVGLGSRALRCEHVLRRAPANIHARW